jgi:hypothetical protein
MPVAGKPARDSPTHSAARIAPLMIKRLTVCEMPVGWNPGNTRLSPSHAAVAAAISRNSTKARP